MQEGIQSKLVEEVNMQGPDRRLPRENIRKTTRDICRVIVCLVT